MKRNCRFLLQASAALQLLVVAALLTFNAPVVSAQEVSAGITGKVTDPSGAAIINATVTARDQERGTTFPTRTNEDGIYAFPRIPIGVYELKIEAPGFKTYVEPNIRLEINQRARRDAQLEIGAVTESVQVTG